MPIFPSTFAPTPIARLAALQPARLPAHVPLDVLGASPRIGGFDGLRVREVAAGGPGLAVGAGDVQVAGGGGAGCVDAVGDGLGIAFVAGYRARVLAAGEGRGGL